MHLAYRAIPKGPLCANHEAINGHGFMDPAYVKVVRQSDAPWA